MNRKVAPAKSAAKSPARHAAPKPAPPKSAKELQQELDAATKQNSEWYRREGSVGVVELIEKLGEDGLKQLLQSPASARYAERLGIHALLADLLAAQQEVQNVPQKRVTTKKAGAELVQRRAPSHQAGYARNNRKGMVGLGVEVPSALREQVQQAADDWGMKKQDYVTALLVAAIVEHKPKPGEPIPLPEAFKGEPDALRRATKLFIAALK
jgi:hypothetical protein